MSTPEERAVDLRAQMRSAMRSTMSMWFMQSQPPDVIESLIEQAVSDGMFPVEHLLVECDALRQEVEYQAARIEDLENERRTA